MYGYTILISLTVHGPKWYQINLVVYKPQYPYTAIFPNTLYTIQLPIGSRIELWHYFCRYWYTHCLFNKVWCGNVCSVRELNRYVYSSQKWEGGRSQTLGKTSPNNNFLQGQHISFHLDELQNHSTTRILLPSQSGTESCGRSHFRFSMEQSVTGQWKFGLKTALDWCR